jgi:FkbM family methyltransferase
VTLAPSRPAELVAERAILFASVGLLVCRMFRRLNLERWRKAVNSFGLRRGTAAYLVFLWHRLIRSANQKTVQMCIPGLLHPVRLRPATTDWVIMQQVFIDRAFSLSQWPEHERAIRARYESAIKRGHIPIIVDCGAHIGLATLWFARRFPDARVFAVEPASENFEILRWNAQPYPNVTPVHAAVWDHETQVSLVNVDGEPWAWETRQSDSGGVQTVTISNFLGREPDCVPLIIKIDIEGSEIEVFRSNLEWIEQTPLIVIELHDWQGGWRGTGHAVFSRLSTHPRDYMQRGENMFSFAHCASRAN